MKKILEEVVGKYENNSKEYHIVNGYTIAPGTSVTFHPRITQEALNAHAKFFHKYIREAIKKDPILRYQKCQLCDP